MKLKILLLTLLLSTSLNSGAKVGDVYFCNIKQVSKVSSEYVSNPIYDNKFTFKRNEDILTFGSKGILSNREYPVNINSINSNVEHFWGGNDTTAKIIYKDNLFLFSTLSFTEGTITSIVANCEIF
jgi:hypothetical protein